MKLFQKVLMASEDVQAYVRSGKYFDSADDSSGKEQPISDGACVTTGKLVANDAYPSVVDFNVRKLLPVAAQTDKVVFVDYVGVSEVDVVGVKYRVGDKTYGYDAPAGTVVRYRQVMPGDMFWLGADNFVSAPSVGQFAAPTVGDTRLTPAASEVEGATNVKIEAVQDIITGMVNDGQKFLCTVVSVA